MPIDEKKFIRTIILLILAFVLILGVTFLLSWLTKPQKVSDEAVSFPKIVDNKLLFYSENTKFLKELDLTTKELKNLKTLDFEVVYKILWSPDGNEALLNTGDSRGVSDKYWYWSLSKDTFSPLDEKIIQISWDSAGKQIFYVLNDATGTLNIAKPDGTNSNRIYDFGESLEDTEIAMSPSPNGEKIAVSIGGTDVSPTDNFLFDVKTKQKSNLTTSQTGSVGDWSSDSQKILFQTFVSEDEGYNWNVKDFSSNKEWSINFSGELSWFPDNQSLVATDGSALWKINGQNGSKKAIYKPKEPSFGYILLSTNGEILYFTNQNILYKKNL